MNRTSPKSNSLKKLSLRFLQNHQNDLAQITAGKIIGSNFNNDDSIRTSLLTEANPATTPGKLTALCIGWPDEPYLKAIFNACAKEKTPITNSAGYYLKFLCRDANHIFDIILNVISSEESRFHHSYFLIPLIRRISIDDQLQGLIIELLLSTDDIDQKVSLYSLIKKIGRISDKIINWRAQNLTVVKVLDYGYNIVSNSIMPFKAVLLSE